MWKTFEKLFRFTKFDRGEVVEECEENVINPTMNTTSVIGDVSGNMHSEDDASLVKPSEYGGTQDETPTSTITTHPPPTTHLSLTLKPTQRSTKHHKNMSFTPTLVSFSPVATNADVGGTEKDLLYVNASHGMAGTGLAWTPIDLSSKYHLTVMKGWVLYYNSVVRKHYTPLQNDSVLNLVWKSCV